MTTSLRTASCQTHRAQSYTLPALMTRTRLMALHEALERERSSTFTLAVVDPQESVIQPLSWYAESIAASRGVVAHFTSPKRQDGEIHNARMALLSGLGERAAWARNS